ncbi:MAG: PLP-dependent aminotransferase family protein [Ruminococcaceae bacterium]|nr:PLP-dependent aminotransferase family protein [Oscillospiraceae bacterium]
MNYTFADRIATLSPSAIREILKFTSDPSVVSLAAGNPAPEAFPTDVIADISARIFRERPIDALQYSITEGYPALRNRLKAYMTYKHHSFSDERDELIVTSGAQQVMELVVKVLCNPNDVILCEAPSFIGSLNSFRSLGAKLVGVPMEADGMDTDALETALKANPNAKFIYTIPNFQNPTGITMSMEKRRRVYALAKQYGVLILEDNPYGDLRYGGEALPNIKSLDKDGLVIYAGTFSKVLSPGIRVGYAVGPKAVIAKMTVAKQGEDVHTAIWSQMLCDEFMGTVDFEEHLHDLQGLYREKAALMCRLLDEHLVPCGITYHPIEGGLFLWCDLPEGVDMNAFCTRAVQEYKVAVVPGNAFSVNDEPCRSFRVNFSTPTDEAMTRGVERLGVFAREFLK